MVKCVDCGGETGDDIPYCFACVDVDKKEREIEKVKPLSAFGIEIDGERDNRKMARRLTRVQHDL